MNKEEIKRIQQFKKSLEAKRSALIELPIDAMTEEQEDRKFNELSERINKAIDAEYDAMVKTIKPNAWVKSFLESFEDCDRKRITLKQAYIFEKNLKHAETKHNTNSFHSKTYVANDKYTGNYNGKIYEVSVFSDCGYLTVREMITI